MSAAGDFIDSTLQREGSASCAETAADDIGDGLRHYGSSVGAVRGTVRDAQRRFPGLSHDEVTALSSELWRVPVFERRLAAVVLLQDTVRLLLATDLTRLEGFVREARLPVLVDLIAIEVIAPLLRSLDSHARSRADKVLARWTDDRNPWLVRAAAMARTRADAVHPGAGG